MSAPTNDRPLLGLDFWMSATVALSKKYDKLIVDIDNENYAIMLFQC